MTFFLKWLQASVPCLVPSSVGLLTTGFLQSPRSGDLTDPWGFIHRFQTPGFNTTKLQCPASWRLQQPRAAVGFAVSSSPVLSAQITQDSGRPFLPPKIPRQKAPGDGASSAAVVCGLQCLRYLPPAASPLTGSFPRVCHHRKFPVGKHSVSKQRVPWYKRRVNMHAAVRKTLNAEAAVARAPGHSPNSLGRTKLPQRLRNSQVRLWSSLAEV